MKLLIIGDIHGNIESFIKIISLDIVQEVDAILLAGDIGLTIFDEENHLDERSIKLNKISTNEIFWQAKGLNIPVLFVPGNWDSKKTRCGTKNAFNIDINGSGDLFFLEQFAFAGIGGSNSINRGFPYEWTEEETFIKVSAILDKSDIKNLIILSHDPPYNSNIDLNYDNIHCGSKSIIKIICKYNPIACFCGHIHEAVGVDHIGNSTVCLNAGIINSRETFGPGVKMNANNENKNSTSEDQFFIADLSTLPLTIARYCLRFNELIISPVPL